MVDPVIAGIIGDVTRLTGIVNGLQQQVGNLVQAEARREIEGERKRYQTEIDDLKRQLEDARRPPVVAADAPAAEGEAAPKGEA